MERPSLGILFRASTRSPEAPLLLLARASSTARHLFVLCVETWSRLVFVQSRSTPTLRVRVETSRLCLRPPRGADVPVLRAALRRNAGHLRPWEPAGSDTSKLAAAVAMVERERGLWRRDEKFTLLVFAKDAPSSAPSVLGKVAISGIHRAAFQSCFLGYWVDSASCNRGIATEAVGATLAFAFGPLGLHRVQAAVMPRNAPSLAVVRKLGFRHEGTAKRYLKIAGAWEDHEIFAMTQEDYASLRETRDAGAQLVMPTIADRVPT